MSAGSTSLPPDYFDRLYAGDADPWRFATSDYERRKYAATLDALPRRRFGSAFEAGCSIGILTRQLAGRCATLLAADVAEAALAEARRHCAGLDHVTFRRLRLPAEWPAQRFDLILLSEILYYLDRADIGLTAARVRESLAPNGAVLLVHWTGPTDYPSGGDEAVEGFLADVAGTLRPVRQYRAPEYRLDLLERPV